MVREHPLVDVDVAWIVWVDPHASPREQPDRARVEDVLRRLGAYEIFDQQNTLGATSFVQNINNVRALEGELSRTISSLARIKSARVHLALPASNGFLRDQQKPTASVLLTLHAGRTLDRAQISGIVHLVAGVLVDLERPGVAGALDEVDEVVEAEQVARAEGGVDRAGDVDGDDVTLGREHPERPLPVLGLEQLA